MSDKSFKLEIVTPERQVLAQDVTSLVAPGVEGYLGVLADHAPLMCELAMGEISIVDTDGQETHIAISGGFMEVKENTVRILADTAERAEEIDLARAQEAVKRAEDRLRERMTDVDLTRAEVALKRAINRLRVARGG
jgi:F-type H+-transporting ATPase subunit epsilon